MISLSAFGQPVGWDLVLSSVAVSLFVFWYVRKQWMPIASRLPPGPPRIPAPFDLILAALAFRKGLQPLQDLRKRYGDIVFVHLGNRPALVISSFDLVQEILIKKSDVTSGRRLLPALNQVLHYEKGGTLLSSGEVWQANRRFTLQALRTMGMGKRTVDDRIIAESEYLAEEVTQRCGQPIDPKPWLYRAVSNVICSVIFGHRFEYSDPTFRKVTFSVESLGAANLGFLADLPLLFFRQAKRQILDIKRVIDEEIAAHESNFSNGTCDQPRDVLDLFLAEISRTEATGEKTLLRKESFWNNIFDLFVGGTETTSTMLSWALLFLAEEEDLRKRIEEEVDTVIGSGRAPSPNDRERMPYTQAFLLEVLRFRPIAPVGIPHLTTSGFMTSRGYYVPKGTDIVMNLLAIHHDPKMWIEPEVFRPERYLSADGTSAIYPPELLTFGAGRRVCLGEKLARTEAFLFLTSLVQRFSFKLPDAAVRPGYGYGNGIQFISPRPYKLIFSER